MKRREFILNLAIAIGASMFVGGCTDSNDKTSEGQVQRRSFGSMSVPLIGFGCMRLPLRHGQIDMVELDKMVDYAMAHGVNYFDVAYDYVEFNCEAALGELLGKYQRDSFFLANKCPVNLIQSPADCERILDEQLKTCKTDYFDNYIIPLNKKTLLSYKNNNIFAELTKLKARGKIKNLGLSFVGSEKMFKGIIKEHNWDFCELQANYLDYEMLSLSAIYEAAKNANVPIIGIQPMAAGILCNLPSQAQNAIKKEYPDLAASDFALKMAASYDNVAMVLSGMSRYSQMKENVSAFINYQEASQRDFKIARRIAIFIQSQGAINCTQCKNCTKMCPESISIPAIFGLYNVYKNNPQKARDWAFINNYNMLDEQKRANSCSDCKLCAKNCPTKLDIPKLLSKIHAEFEKLEGELA